MMIATQQKHYIKPDAVPPRPLHTGSVHRRASGLPGSAGAQLYVTETGTNTIGEYNATTGTAINPKFIIGLSGPAGLIVIPPPCTLIDTASYDATTSTLTMNFTVGNNENSAVMWNAWLTYQDTIESLFSESLPITNPPAAITKTKTDLPKEGEVGILSTLTTATAGIVCSSYVQTNTGTP
jgi:hypothetical protein